MGIIKTVPLGILALPGEHNVGSMHKGHHSKTIDIGLDGNTVSTNPFGDVYLYHLSCNIPSDNLLIKY
jgi:hypothetical protein